MGQLRDLLLQYEETLEKVRQSMLRQEKVVKRLEKRGQFDEQYDYESQQLAILRRMYYDKKYETEWIELGHAPDDYNGIHSRRVGENDFADRYRKEDRQTSKKRTILQRDWR